MVTMVVSWRPLRYLANGDLGRRYVDSFVSAYCSGIVAKKTVMAAGRVVIDWQIVPDNALPAPPHKLRVGVVGTAWWRAKYSV